MGGPIRERPWARVVRDGAAQPLSQLVAVSRSQRWRGQRPHWWVPHSVPMGTGYTSIDHLLGGPPGIFTATTKHRPLARVTLAEDMVSVNRYPSDYATASMRRAERAQRLLHTALADGDNPGWASYRFTQCWRSSPPAGSATDNPVAHSSSGQPRCPRCYARCWPYSPTPR